jgi:hypothetical protein
MARRRLRRFHKARRREEADEKELVGESALMATEAGGKPLALVGAVVLLVVTVEEELLVDALEAASSRAEATSRRQMRMRFCLAVDMGGGGGM